MTGEGSDELFGGYPAFRRDMFLHGLDDLPQEERASWESLLQKSNALVKGAMLAENQVDDPDLDAVVGFTPSCLQPWLACAPLVPELLAQSHAEALKGYSPGKAIAAQLDADQLDGRHALDKAQYVWIKTMLEGQILTWGGDRVDMGQFHGGATCLPRSPSGCGGGAGAARIADQGKTEKYVLREAMAGLLPEVLYRREKFAFMAPPAHTEPEKWEQMKQLADDYLSDEAIDAAGLLSKAGVRALFARHEDPATTDAERVQMDAVINHLLGVQMLHRMFVAEDVPALARREADRLGWRVLMPV